MSFNVAKFGLILTALLAVFLHLEAHADLGDFLAPGKLKGKIKEEIADLDIAFSTDIGDVDLIDGVNLSALYRYEVEPSYQHQYFTRIDKWDLNSNINVGDVVSNVIDSPFTFEVKRHNSFFFVRQFKNRMEALSALPYSPKRLPLNAKKALSELRPGDFVSMPANLTIAVGAGVSSATVAPVILTGTANIYYIISGEFTIQVYKIDESRVRLKLISMRGYDRGVKATGGVSFQFFGIRIIDKQIDRLLDRDLVQLGYSINPGAQFIADYIFDLKDAQSAAAYNQILNSTLKFRDVVVLNDLDNARELKDKLISTYEKAEKIFEADKDLEPAKRRVSRIFKGFNNYRGHTNHLKLALLLASFTNDRAYTENRITTMDKNEKNMEFFYPAYSRYMETKVGKWFFELKDQSFQNNFGRLIPRLHTIDQQSLDPDFGLTFERKDKRFTGGEQRTVQKFMVGEIPDSISKNIDMGEWKNGLEKKDSRIFFQLIIKGQGFDHLKNFSRKELRELLLTYVQQKKKAQILDASETPWESTKDFLFLSRYIKTEQVRALADKLFDILQLQNEPEAMLKRLVKLNEFGIFDKIGVGFLISLLPPAELESLVYLKLEMIAQKVKPVNFEFGRLNYPTLYKQLNEVQARLSNRSFDLRITPDDLNDGHKSSDFDQSGVLSMPGLK